MKKYPKNLSNRIGVFYCLECHKNDLIKYGVTTNSVETRLVQLNRKHDADFKIKYLRYSHRSFEFEHRFKTIIGYSSKYKHECMSLTPDTLNDIVNCINICENSDDIGSVVINEYELT